MSYFAIGSLAVGALVAGLAALLRGRSYAMFRAVLLTIHALIASAIWPHVGILAPVFLYLHATVYAHSLALTRPRMRPWYYRLAISWPEAFFQAGTILSLPVALISLGWDVAPPWWFVGYGIAALGMLQSLGKRADERHDLLVGNVTDAGGLKRTPEGGASERPLRLVQITDPHLGTFMSVDRLRQVCERAVAQEPDLVLLTGDFLTMESQGDPGVLGAALAPLLPLKGRTFACFGNHDLEAPLTVKTALQRAGVKLLIDQASELDTAGGRVQLLGMQFRWRGRAEHLQAVCAAHPRRPGMLRLVMLHDPGAFVHLPPGEGDLVLSGHTHGGQLGLVSFGLRWTILRLFARRIPDHGFWARGSDRLYVHRGTGHYGFPLRLGVPAEESVLLVHRA